MRFGLSVALATPFDKDGRIALGAMVAHARRSLNAGCASVTLFGTTGEGASVGNREREAVLEAMIAGGIAPRQIVAGVLVDAAEDAADQAAYALAKDVRNILLAPPSYFKNVSEDGLFGWYSTVFTLLGDKARDIIVYHIPSVTMVPLTHSLIGRLRQAFPGVVTGVKDSGGEWNFTETLLKEHGDLIILVGDERHLAQSVRLGGQGAISGVANFLPQEVRRMAVEGEDSSRVVDLVIEMLAYPVTPAVKALTAHVTNDPAWMTVRPPLLPTPDDVRRKLETVFDALFRKAV